MAVREKPAKRYPTDLADGEWEIVRYAVVLVDFFGSRLWAIITLNVCLSHMRYPTPLGRRSGALCAGTSLRAPDRKMRSGARISALERDLSRT